MLIFTGYQVEAHFVPVVSGLEPLWLNKQIRSNLVRHQAWTNGHCIHTLATLYTIRLTLFTILSILALYSPWPAAASARPVKNQNRRIWTKKLWRLLFFETHSIYRRRRSCFDLCIPILDILSGCSLGEDEQKCFFSNPFQICLYKIWNTEEEEE